MRSTHKGVIWCCNLINQSQLHLVLGKELLMCGHREIPLYPPAQAVHDENELAGTYYPKTQIYTLLSAQQSRKNLSIDSISYSFSFSITLAGFIFFELSNTIGTVSTNKIRSQLHPRELGSKDTGVPGLLLVDHHSLWIHSMSPLFTAKSTSCSDTHLS